MKKLKVILIGAGNRGALYTGIMKNYPDKFEVIAVAEPIESRRLSVQKTHNIPNEMCFEDYNDLLKLGKIADIAVIATMDRLHLDPSIKAIELKYDLLLEKPIATTPEECMKIAKCAEQNNVKVIVCTVLRYTDIFKTIKDTIDSGKIGEIISVNHEECVGNVHQSHSFVRGNWGNIGRSSFMLLQKSCHDLDLLQWLLGKKCKKVQSFGSLTYFTRKNAPKGSPEYCIEGCPVGDTCPYNSVNLYLKSDSSWFRTTSTKLTNPTDADVEKAMRETQYGKCVYKCDNDVVDHQTVNMLFEDDITVTFSMNAFNKGGRFIHIFGTKGELHAGLGKDEPYIKVYDFNTKETSDIQIGGGADGIEGGHGGGDNGIIVDLYDYMCTDYCGKSVPNIHESCYNHMLVFASEKARNEGTIVDIDDYIASFN